MDNTIYILVNLRFYSALSVPCVICTRLVPRSVSCTMPRPLALSSILLGGLDGTGGLSIIGVLARDGSGSIPQWIAIHVVDNHQVQDIADSKSFVAYKAATPVVWSPMWYTQSRLPCGECPGNLELSSYNRIHWTY